MLVASRMTRDPITVTNKTSIDEALKVMRDKKVRRLPVVDEKGKLGHPLRFTVSCHVAQHS